MKIPITILLLSLAGFGQEQQQPIQDLKLLIGKQVTVQRQPLCQPGTYTVVLSYAGKQATVVSMKPSKITPLSPGVMAGMPPQARAMMEDAQKAAIILLQSEDGTQRIHVRRLAQARYSIILSQPKARLFNPPTTRNRRPLIRPLPSTKDVLSDDEVKLAVSGKGKDHLVLIQDMGLMAAQGNQVPTITLYMPEAVLAIRAESAKKQFIRYEPAEEDKRRSLMVVAQGYAGTTIAEGCTSITRIVLLSDPSGGLVQEAYMSEPLAETWRNGFALQISAKLCGRSSRSPMLTG